MPTDLFLTNPTIARPVRTHHADAALALVIALCVVLLLIVTVRAPAAGAPDGGTADDAVSLIGP